jgi:hypothetical protein
MGEGSGAVEDILESLLDLSGRQDEIFVNNIVTAFGDRGWGPFLFAPAIV